MLYSIKLMRISALALALLIPCCLLPRLGMAQGQAAPPEESQDSPREENQAAPPEGNQPAPQEADQAAPQTGSSDGIDIAHPENRKQPGTGPQEDAPPAPSEEPAGDMTLDDAAGNFESILQAFVISRSPNGYWPLREKTTKKVLMLKLESIDLKSLRQEGPNVFTAPAVLLDVNNDRKIPAEFTIDFSGTQWHVTRMRMLKAPAKAPEGEDER